MVHNYEHSTTSDITLDTNIDRVRPDNEKKRKRTYSFFLINNLLLAAGLAVVFSGLVLQLGFHMGDHNENNNAAYAEELQSIQYEQLRQIDTEKIVSGFNYYAWTAIHKFAIVVFSLLIVYHTYVHWKWYRGVITKHLIGKNKQVIILSALFLAVALTGIIPWFIDLTGSNSVIRLLLIEIHDKLTFVLILFLVLHFVKRAKWYGSAYAKLRKNKPQHARGPAGISRLQEIAA